MRSLVAGASGFLGSHLVEKLLGQGHEVLAVDNLYSGARVNLEHLSSNSNLEVLRHDVTLPLFVEVDEIYNLASPASPVSYQLDPVRTMKTNVLGSINLLGLAKRLNVRIFQASTSEVYGDPRISPQGEEYWGNVNPIGIRSCYDEGKRAAETLFMDYHRQHGVSVKIARIFNTYGPRMAVNDGRVVSNFITQALTGNPLTIYGEGTQTRSFCYVSDLIDGILALMASTEELTGPINLGNPQEIQVSHLAELILEKTGSDSVITSKPLPADDPLQRKPDITKAGAVLNWQPQTTLEDGLDRTIAYFREVLQ